MLDFLRSREGLTQSEEKELKKMMSKKRMEKNKKAVAKVLEDGV